MHDRADDGVRRFAPLINQSVWSRFAGPAVTALAYLLSAILGEALAFPSAPVSALWAPNAILFAALLLAPVSRWWIYLAAILPCQFFAQIADDSLAQIGIQYIVNSAEAMLSAAALLLLEREPRRLGQLRAMTNLVLIGGIAAPLITSVAMAMAFVPLGLTNDPWLTMFARTSTNTFATITLVPLILHFAERTAGGWHVPERRTALEASVIGGCLAIVCVYVFVWPGAYAYGERAPALLYAPLPFLIWATVRYEIAGVCLSVLLVGAFATWGVVHEVGPFVVHSPVRNALTTVLFLNVICIPLLMLAAVLQERKAAAAEAARLDQQLAHLSRVATVGEISGAVAHEIRQPLASMLANAEAAATLLASGEVDMKTVKPIVADIIADNRRAAQVIKRMQSMLRHSQTERRPEQLNELVTETLALSRGDLHRRQVMVIQSLGSELPRVAADRVQIQQVILNLIVNACDAMEDVPPDQRKLWINTSVHPHLGVELTVRDCGPGIEESMLERVFESFVSTKPTGLGLGLSISRKIMIAHGGRLWAERSAAGGAIFRLTLPRAPRG